MPRLPRVLVDATSIPATSGGVARFITGLLVGLEEIDFVVDVVAKRRDLPSLQKQAPAHRYVAASPITSSRPLRFVWEQTGLPLLARRLQADVIYSPHYTFPLIASAARVVTLHDATFFSSPEVHSRLKGVFFRTWIRLANAKATALVAASRATADEVRRYVVPSRPDIAVGYLGVDRAVFSPPSADAIASVRERIGLAPDEPWIAFLGTIEPRKNLPALIEAHQLLRASDPATPVLVLSGARGWDDAANAALDAIAGEKSEKRSVIEAGYLPLKLLSAFLGGAQVVVYPSLGEGFGLPVLEAMSSGVAVLTTRRLSLPEVGGDAVEYAEPDPLSLAESIRALLADDSHRATLAAAGLERSAKFTWRECGLVYARAFQDASTGRAAS